jgi:WD40 repeat protein
VDQARAGRFSGRVGQRFKSLEAIAQAARIARERDLPAERLDLLRNLAVSCLALPDLRQREWDGWPEGSKHLDFNTARELYVRTDLQGNAHVHRIADAAEVASLAGQGVPVKPLFCDDGTVLALHEQAAPHRLKLWRLAEPGPFRVLTGLGDVEHLALSPDGGRLAVARKGGTVQLYSLAKEKPAAWAGNPRLLDDSVSVLQFSPDGRWLAMGRRSGGVNFYNTVTSGGPSFFLPGGISRIAFQPGGSLAAVTAGVYPSPVCWAVHLYDLATGQQLRSLDNGNGVSAMAWRGDGKVLAACTIDTSKLQLWDPVSGQRLQTLTHKGGGLWVVASRTGDLFATVPSWSGGLCLWHAGNGRELLCSPDLFPNDLRPTADGRLLQVSAEGRKLKLLEVVPGYEFRTLTPGTELSPDAIYQALAADPWGRLLAAATSEGIFLWDLATGWPIRRLSAGSFGGVLFDREGNLYASGTSGVCRWPVRVHEGGQMHIGPVERVPGSPETGAGGLSGSLDGRLLVTTGGLAFPRGALLLQRNRPDEPLWLGPHHDVRHASVSPDGRLAATGNWFEDPQNPAVGIKVWETERGALAKEFPLKNMATPEFSPDDRWLGTSSRTGFQLWERGTWKEVLSFAGTGGPFTPDGRLVVQDRGDAVVRLLEVPAGREVVALDNPLQARARRRAFSPDGRYLLFGSHDLPGTHVWDLHALRRGLAELGLDWSSDPLPEIPPPPQPRVTVEEGPSPVPPSTPAVVALPPPAAKPPRPEEIVRWVRQLTEGDVRTRTKTADALTAAGPAAVKALSAAVEGPEGERRRQARAVLDRIAVAEALAPRLVRLKLEDALAADAVTSLARHSHLPLAYSAQPGAVAPRKRIRLTLDGVPAWEALDRLCAAGSLDYRVDVSSISVYPQTQPRPRIGLQVGPFAVKLYGAYYHRRLNLLDSPLQPAESLSLNILLQQEPLPSLLSVFTPRWTEARDEKGQSLLVPAQQSYPLYFNGRMSGSVMVQVKPREGRGGKIELLRGVLPVEVRARPRDLLTVPDLARAAGKTFGSPRGHELHMDAMQNFGGQQWMLQVRLRGPQGWAFDPMRPALEMTDAHGHWDRFENVYLAPTPLQGPQREDLALLAAAPQAPGPLQPPWPALAIQSWRRPRTE